MPYLIAGLFRVIYVAEKTHFMCLVEQRLAKYLAVLGVPLTASGELQDFHGERIPYIGSMLDTVITLAIKSSSTHRILLNELT